MNNTKKIVIALFALCASASQGLAQTSTSTTANASATIITPLAIAKTTDMDFGNVAVNTNAGTVVMTAAGARSTTGGALLPAVTGSPTQAVFNVTGQANYVYTITLPTNSPAFNLTSGSNTMVVSDFTSNPTAGQTGGVGNGTLNGSGLQVVGVGATLNVAASQAAGTYTAATPFTVTVNYN